MRKDGKEGRNKFAEDIKNGYTENDMEIDEDDADEVLLYYFCTTLLPLYLHTYHTYISIYILLSLFYLSYSTESIDGRVDSSQRIHIKHLMMLIAYLTETSSLTRDDLL